MVTLSASLARRSSGSSRWAREITAAFAASTPAKLVAVNRLARLPAVVAGIAGTADNSTAATSWR